MMQGLPAGVRHPSIRMLLGIVVATSWSSIASPDALKKSGYAIGSDRCGTGSLSFPALQIDMKQGFCAGLVASEDDDLRFPRSIVQIPDHK